MKKVRVLINMAFILLIILGLVFATYYFSVYVRNTRHFIYFVFALFAVAESLFTGLSFGLHLRELQNKYVKIIYIISAILAIPILLFTLFWILYCFGIQIVPPTQQ